jgi:hypothetical protein
MGAFPLALRQTSGIWVRSREYLGRHLVDGWFAHSTLWYILLVRWIGVILVFSFPCLCLLVSGNKDTCIHIIAVGSK